MYCNVCTGALMGIHAYLVQAEVDVSTGLPGFEMVGHLSGEVKDITTTRLIQNSIKESA